MKTSLRNFLITFLSAIVIFAILAYFVSSFVTATITDSLEGTPAVSLEIITDALDTSVPEDTETHILDTIDGESFNFLFIGTDYQPDLLNDYDVESKYTDSFPKKRNREYSADALVLVRFDKEGKKLLVSSIPSNMRLEVNGHITTLGKVYFDNGLEYFINTVSAMTGLEIDKYIVIDVEDFAPIIDLIGEITFDVPENMSYEDPQQKLIIDLKKGKQKLDGKASEQLLRFDDYVNSSNSRAKTTADFFVAVADKIADSSLIKNLTTFYKSFDKYITTNFTADDLTSKLDIITHYKDFEKVITTYPGKYINNSGSSVFDPDIKSAINDYAEFR